MRVFIPNLDTHAPVLTVKKPDRPTCHRGYQGADVPPLGSADGHGSDAYPEANRAVRAAIGGDCRADIASRIREQGPHTMWRNTR